MKPFINNNSEIIFSFAKVILISTIYFIFVGMSLAMSAAGLNVPGTSL